jgi:hypothetical protein
MPEQQPNRAASASIQGYLYQFDRTIIEVLESSEESTITIEGIEDIDLNAPQGSEVVQCKYLQATKFSLAAIREAIIPMLQSSRTRQDLNYRLYIYCGQGGDVLPALTLDQLKECLTLRKRDGTIVQYYDEISEDELVSFTTRLNIVEGVEFQENRAQVYKLLQQAMSCTPEDSRELYYANALSQIYDRAILREINQRKITKVELLKQINTKTALYTRWHIETIGIEKYIAMSKRRLNGSSFFDPKFARCLLIKHSATFAVADYLSIANALARDQYGVGKLMTAKPWTIIIDGSPDVISGIKQGLIDREVMFNDGYESIKFSVPLFDKWPVVNSRGRGSTIGKTSYDVRLISAATFKGNCSAINAFDRFIAITDGELESYMGQSPPLSLQISNVSMVQIKEMLGV